MLLSILCLVTVAVCGVMQRKGTGNFPIDGCSTDEMDFLFLYNDFYYDRARLAEHNAAYQFAATIKGSNGANRRVTFAGVYDSFSENKANVNVSTWNFTTSSQFSEYENGKQRVNTPYYDNVNKSIELKIQFVQRLFSEMAGVRENASHIAVIFLYGYRLSYEESRTVPYVVQQYVTDIKIFIVLINIKYVHHTILLRDTLLVGYSNGRISGQLLLAAICNHCLEGWFSLRRRSDHTDELSCYLLMPKSTYSYAVFGCMKYFSFMVTIETREELNFLQTHLSAVLKDNGYLRFDPNGSSQLSAQIYIAIRKDTRSFATRFHWPRHWAGTPVPLVINHWSPGKPSGGLKNGCVIWQFVWNVTRDNVTSLPGNESLFVDGWEDVGCKDKLSSFSLCEMVLPRRVEDKNLMRVKPASNESVSQALTKGHFRIYRDNIVSISANIASIHFVEFLKQTEPNLFPIFDCGVGTPDPRYISYIYVCDSVNHCSNRRDEIYCVDRSQKHEDFAKRCSGVNCCDGFCLPLHRVGDGEIDCNVCGDNTDNEVNDESMDLVRSSKRNESCALFCNVDDECVHFSQLNDSHTDCTGPEGPLDETIGKLETADTCYNILGHRIWAPRCVYVRDRYGAVLGCRDMSHLKDCVEFECPDGYTKCPDTYCIPQHYVLDGTIDCPAEEDENVYYIIGSCTGNFACWNSKMCLHPDLVCNGHPDCPHQDDEVDCHVTCSEGVRCISGTATIIDYNRSIAGTSFSQIDRRSRYLDFSRVNLHDLLFDFVGNLENITTIILSNCNIKVLGYGFYATTIKLQELDLSYNLMKTLDGWEIAFPHLENIRLLNLSYNRELDQVNNLQFRFLETLDLSHTSVSQLQESFLDMLPSLKHLDLSFTKISNFNKNIFPANHILLTLDLRGLPLKDFYENFFNGLSISQDLYTDRFELCCPQIRGANIPYHTCHAPDDAISSCFNLVGVTVQRVLLWVVAVLAVLGNITVIVYRVIWDRSVLKIGYGMFVTNLGVSDFIMGVYLFIIAGADYYYRDIYVLSDKTWREGFVCRFAGFMATLSSETSTFFVFLITLDRFLVMKFPFGHNKLNEMNKLMILLFSWIIGFLLALTPVVVRFEIYSSNAMCLGLPLTTERLYGWEFSFGVFIILNFCLFLLIVYGQKAIFSAMSENRMTQIASRRAEDITVAKQLSLVALSNFLCWFPVGLMGLLSLGGHVISNDVYAWTTVIVLPINAAANPLLYTIPVLMAKWERFKTGATRTMQTST